MLFPANMTLFIPEGQTTLTYDQYGNPIESKQALGEYLVSVSEDAPELQANAGLDTAMATYTGRCVGKIVDEKYQNVKFFPSTVIPNQRLECSVTDLASGRTQMGTFVVLSAFQSRYKVVTKVLGSRVQGYFEFGR